MDNFNLIEFGALGLLVLERSLNWQSEALCQSFFRIKPKPSLHINANQRIYTRSWHRYPF